MRRCDRQASGPRRAPSRAPTPSSNCSRPWTLAMLGWLSDASVRASRSKRASRSASAANASGRTLMATCRSEVGIGGPIDLAHSAFAKLGGNLVGPEPRAYLHRVSLATARRRSRAIACELWRGLAEAASGRRRTRSRRSSRAGQPSANGGGPPAPINAVTSSNRSGLQAVAPRVAGIIRAALTEGTEEQTCEERRNPPVPPEGGSHGTIKSQAFTTHTAARRQGQLVSRGARERAGERCHTDERDRHAGIGAGDRAATARTASSTASA